MNRVVDTAYERLVGRGLFPFYETRLRGRQTFRYRDEFEANQWRSPQEIAALQWERLRALLKHAYETVPYYRDAFDALAIRPEQIATPADFARLPVLEKATVREKREQLLSSAFDPKELIASATGGSTGEPMRFYYDRNSYERRMAAAMRGDGWAGWRLCAPEFHVWGAPLLPEARLSCVKRRLHHALLRRTVINSFELSRESAARIARRYNAVRPRVVIGYANALYEFARYLRTSRLALHRPVGVISSAEKLHDYQRAVIEEAFQAPVFDRYGCREVMMIAAECERHDGLHLTADNLYVEIVRNGQPCEPGEIGEILLTDLHNYGMPLIRYKVGDVGSWKAESCPCGRGLPLLNVVEGRVLDLISTPDGRVLPGEFFPHLMKDFAAIRAYQVVQDRKDALSIRVALEEPMAESRERQLKETVARAVGPQVQIAWEIGPEVEIRTADNHKFRPVLSRVPVEWESKAHAAPCSLPGPRYSAEQEESHSLAGSWLSRAPDRRAAGGDAPEHGVAGTRIVGRNIICYAHDWDGDPLSKTHIMRVLARDNRILWVNSLGHRTPSATAADVGRIVKKLKDAARGVVEVEPNIHVLAPLYVPAFGSAAIRALNQKILRAQIRWALRRLGMKRPISWSYLPSAVSVVGAFGEPLIIYQVVDENSAFSDASPHVAEMERRMLEEADLVIASAESLRASKSRINPRTVLVRHGVDLAHFSKALLPDTPIPAEIAGLPRPVIGFFGLIADWIDLELIRKVADAYPHGSLVLIGKVTTDLRALEGASNIHLLGRKPYALLPGYCKGFDVALTPFRLNELAYHANPLKAREYVAAGLPNICTDLPELRQIPGCTVAASHEAFLAAVEQALSAGPGPSRERSELMRAESWEARVEEICGHVLPLLADRTR